MSKALSTHASHGVGADEACRRPRLALELGASYHPPPFLRHPLAPTFPVPSCPEGCFTPLSLSSWGPERLQKPAAGRTCLCGEHQATAPTVPKDSQPAAEISTQLAQRQAEAALE